MIKFGVSTNLAFQLHRMQTEVARADAWRNATTSGPNGGKSMNSYSNWPKTTRHPGSHTVPPGSRFAVQSFAICISMAVAVLFLLMFSVPAQANNHLPCKDGTPPPCSTGTPISISVTQNMAFGTLAPDVSISGTAVINPSTGTKTVTGGVFDFGGVHNPAIFAVTGKKNTAFTITLPAAITLDFGGNSMTLNTFTSNPAVGLLDGAGTATLTVGATLQVGTNQPAGAYTGIFDVTVNY